MAETLVGWNRAKGYGVPAPGLIDQAEAGPIMEPIEATDMQRASMRVFLAGAAGGEKSR